MVPENAGLAGHDIEDLPAHHSALGLLTAKHGADLTSLVQSVQRRFGFLPRNVLEHVARSAGVPLARLYGLATFYGSFHLKPRGKHVLRVCTGTACHVGGAHRITEAVSARLKVQPGETTEDRLFTLDTVACVGCCSLAPVMMVGEASHGRLDGPAAVKVVDALSDRERAIP